MTKNLIKNDLFNLLKLTLPLTLIGMTQSANFFFETAFLARLGEESLAAGALASWLYMILIGCVFGVMSSINILIAHRHGERNIKEISYIFRDGLVLAVLFSIPSMLILWKIAPVFELFGLQENLLKLAELYLHPLILAVLPNLITIALIELLIGIGHARQILIFTLISVFLVIFSSYVLIFGKLGFPALGIAGAGWGTAAGNIISALLLALYILFRENYRVYCKNIFSFQRRTKLKDLLRLGVPIGIMYCLEIAFFLALTLMMGTINQSINHGWREIKL